MNRFVLPFLLFANFLVASDCFAVPSSRKAQRTTFLCALSLSESATDAEIDEIDRLIAEKEAEKEKLASSLEQMKLITKSLEMMHGRDEETVAETLRASRRLLASHRARMAGPQIQVGGYARSDFDSNLHDEAFDMPICID